MQFEKSISLKCKIENRTKKVANNIEIDWIYVKIKESVD